MDDTKLRQPFIKKQKNFSKRKIAMKRRQNPWTLKSLLVNLQWKQKYSIEIQSEIKKIKVLL